MEIQGHFSTEINTPIVFISAHSDIPSSVRAMKLGAVDFLMKPFEERDFQAAIMTALSRDRKQTRRRLELTDLRQRHGTLTPREQEVFFAVVSGLVNKQGAAALGISEVTFQIHRSRIMKKMAARSFADLVRYACTLEALADVQDED